MNTWHTISKDQKTVTLSRFEGYGDSTFSEKKLTDEDYKVACVIDFETTGLDRFKDSVIEIGLRLFYFDPSDGKILGIGESYSSLNDPKSEVDSKVTKITGLKYSDLKNQQIDWVAVSELLDNVSLIIAHNAAFDRHFLDLNLQYSKRVIWACTLQQIDWINHGFPSANLQLLSAFHGYFSSSHRALSDVDSLLKLLSCNPKYMLELYQNAHISKARIKIMNTAYEHRNELKKLRYLWNPVNKTWRKMISKKEVETEIQLIKDALKDFEPQIEVEDIPLSENFKVHS